MLEIDDIYVGYGEVICLRGISLTVNAGEIVTLIGANGAGKSTTLKSVSGLLKPKRGAIRFEGEPIHGMPTEHIVARGVIHVPEGRRIFPELSVEENLQIGGLLLPDRKRLNANMARVFDQFPRLKERRRQAGGTLSGGEQQMLAFGRAMMAEPRLLLLDEPSLGLAPIMVSEVMRMISAFKKSGISVLLVEQNAHVALSIADRGYVIATGEVALSDTSAALARHPEVMASYLGMRAEGSASA